jgi:hypothetical protein
MRVVRLIATRNVLLTNEQQYLIEVGVVAITKFIELAETLGFVVTIEDEQEEQQTFH